MKKLGLSLSPHSMVKSTELRLISKLIWPTSSMGHAKGVPTPFAPSRNSTANHTSTHLMHVQRECPSSRKFSLLPYRGGLSFENLHLKERPLLAQNVFCRLDLGLGLGSLSSLSTRMNQSPLQILSSRYLHHATDDSLTRDWLVKLWLVEKKSKKKVPVRNARNSTKWSSYASLSGISPPSPRSSPPPSQSATVILQPTSPDEFKVAPLLARSNLLITRDIEWANLMLGFEQENRYAVVDAYYPGAPVGFISEQSNVIARQILRTRRPFIAKITDSSGVELFRVRRPFWWINSTIFAEIDGEVIGVVHRRWHLWRRVYDLYLGNKQFAVVENPGFWNWTFTLKDINGNVLAEIDRDWRGFGFELLTDAGQYVIRFGDVNPGSKTGPAKMIKDLEIDRPLNLSERAVTVALAVSLDNDYFSRHGGWGIPFFMVTE